MGAATTAAMSLLAPLHLEHAGWLQLPAAASAFAPPRSAAARSPRAGTPTFVRSRRPSGLEDGGAALPLVTSTSPIPLGSDKPLVRLTHKQEVHLLSQMRAYPAHTSLSQAARQTLLMHNLPLVHSVVTKILRTRPHLQSTRGAKGTSAAAALSRDDLVHEGVVGLAEAIDRYDLAYAKNVGDAAPPPGSALPRAAPTPPPGSQPAPPAGARLGTYATYWIRARVLRAIQTREHFVRFPEHALLASHRLARAVRDMGLEWRYVAEELMDYGSVISVGRERLRERLRQAAGIKSDGLFREAVRVRNMSLAGAVTRLEPWMTPSPPSATGKGEGEGGELASQAGQEHILDTLSKFLVPREVEVLRLRYGLALSEEGETFSESKMLSEDLSSSPARVARNYQAEAEEDLFGLEGILSHYSETPREAVAVFVDASSTPAQNGLDTSQSSRCLPLLPFKEIGKRMKFSGEYCRRTCAQAVDKLKCAAEEGRLDEADFMLGW